MDVCESLPDINVNLNKDRCYVLALVIYTIRSTLRFTHLVLILGSIGAGILFKSTGSQDS